MKTLKKKKEKKRSSLLNGLIILAALLSIAANMSKLAEKAAEYQKNNKNS